MAKEQVYDATLGEVVEIEVDNQPAPNECFGCTNPFALNYSVTKTIDDGSCTYCVNGFIYPGNTIPC